MHLTIVFKLEAFIVEELRNFILADVCVACYDALSALEHLAQIMLAYHDVIEDTAAVLL